LNAAKMFEFNETLEQARGRNIRDALEEDIGKADWTSLLLDAQTQAEAELKVRESAVLCGTQWFEGCLFALDSNASIQWLAKEGELMRADSIVCRITAKARALLGAERSSMNFLQLLSATATKTHRYVQAINEVSRQGQCLIMDTRKTIPGLRQAQKYAVRVGGGTNQRLALWDGILIKENHIMAAGGIGNAMTRARARALNAGVPIQIEVENLDELTQALAAGADNILIDNFNLDDMRKAVAATRGRAVVEASGGIQMSTVRDIAATGVDRISIGSLTKDIQATDYSLRVTARNGERIVGADTGQACG
jgi:nicotinate-nucleotide pyrophosphorylase (carboxylating)